jgi:hypothetical protein
MVRGVRIPITGKEKEYIHIQKWGYKPHRDYQKNGNSGREEAFYNCHQLRSVVEYQSARCINE